MNKFLKHFFYVPLAFVVLGTLSSCGGGGGGVSSGGGGTTLFSVFLPAANTITGSFNTSEPSFSGNHGLAQIGVQNAHERGYFGQDAILGEVSRSGSTTSGISNAAGVITTHIVADNVSAASGSGLHTFTTDDFGMTAIASIIQVIAPSVSISALSFATDAELLSVYADAATNSVHILNNSWVAEITVSGSYDGNDISSTKVPLLRALFDSQYDNGMVSLFSDIVATVGTADMVFVYAAGDQGWHDGGSVEFSTSGSISVVSQSDFIAGFSLDIGGGEVTAFSELNIDPNEPGGYSWGPLYEESLVGRWLHVIAVDNTNNINDFSNGCGNVSKYWCLAAPGVNISVDSTTTTVGMRSGTGVAASYASGGLALLRSRLPDMPMSIILALLFETATDLGETGIDDVYGHGLVNLSAAINLQGNVTLVAPLSPPSVTTTMTTGMTTTMTTGMTTTMTTGMTTTMTTGMTTTMTTGTTRTTTTMTSFATTFATILATITTSTSLSFATATVTVAATTGVSADIAVTSTTYLTTALPYATTTIAAISVLRLSSFSNVVVTLPAAATITGTYNTAAVGFTLNNNALSQIGAHHAYERGYFGQGVTVGVIGAGVRTTHIDLTANLIPGLHYNNNGDISNANIADDNGIGTFAAGIIGAAVNDTLAHGVAPQSSIFPLLVPIGYGNVIIPRVFDGAVANGVQILNNSWSSKNTAINGFRQNIQGFYEEGNARGQFQFLYIDGIGGSRDSEFISRFREISEVLATEEVAAVWAAGDFGWNEQTGMVQFYPFNPGTGNYDASFFSPESIINGFSHVSGGVTISLATLSLDPNFGGVYAQSPIYQPSLLGRWAHAVAVDSSSVIASFSNGCGADTKYWCLAAPGGEAITGLSDTSNTAVKDRDGSTAYSAAYISGALAVLRSRLPAMPMSVVLALLFETATDLGVNGVADGVDDVYGHGLVNLERAITVQGNVSLVLPFIDITPEITSTTFFSVTTASRTSVTSFGAVVSITAVTTSFYVYGSSTITLSLSSTNALITAVVPAANTITAVVSAANTITGSYDTTGAEFARNYGLSQIGAHYAYERGYFGQGVTVAIYGEAMRTAHRDLTARILPGIRFNYDGTINNAAINSDTHANYSGERSNGFGTGIAGIIGATRDGTNVHGVAPSVSMLPIQFVSQSITDTKYAIFRSFVPEAFKLVATSSISIMNNSWNHDVGDIIYGRGGRYDGSDLGGTQGAIAFLPHLLPGADTSKNLTNHFSELTAAITTADMALVWAAGDFGWNTETGLVELFTNINININSHRFSITAFLDNYSFVDSGTTISLSTLSLYPNFAGGYALAPIYEPSLLGRWAHVIAVDSNSVIASFSNACGTATKYWCLAAPGVGIAAIASYNNDIIHSPLVNGTAYSAGHVSGALAVLKSRLPTMPMSVILALLFHTATDLGETGVDDVYGHGLLNLERAITVQGNVGLAFPAVISATLNNITAFFTSAVFVSVTSYVTSTMTSTSHFLDTVTSTMATTVTIFMTTTTTPVTTAIINTVFSTTAIATSTISNYTVSIAAANAITGSYDTAAAEYTLDYGLAQIGAHHAYERGYFGQGVTVAIFGEGVNIAHIDLTANLISGVRYNADGSINSNDIRDESGNSTPERTHGFDTFGAGIIGAEVNNTLAHGVAPSVKMLPIKVGIGAVGGTPYIYGAALGSALNLAATSGVHILHNGWNHNWSNKTAGGGRYDDNDLGGSEGAHVYFPPLLGLSGLELLSGSPSRISSEELITNFSQITAAITTADMAVVWAAGDFGWNAETGEVALVTNTGNAIPASLVAINDFLSGYSYISNVDSTTISLATLSLDSNFAGGFALGPVYAPSLLGRWAHAIAVDSNSVIASFSNACGTDTKYWCLAAPGVDLTGLDHDSDGYETRGTNSGTAYSAAYVSGALAVLKSRLPAMPMSVILALLFHTATDLGETGVDDIYGHGLLNLEKAINLQGGIALAIPTTTVTAFMTTAVSSMTISVTTTMTATASANNNLLQSKSKVSPLLAALKEQLREVSAAVEFLPGYYYNTPLGALIEVSDTNSNLSNLGGAASSMLSQTQSQEMGFGLSVLENKGTLLQVSHKTEFGRFNYDICTYCEPSLWEEEQTNATPFFASNRPQMSYAAKLGELEFFAATGIEDTTTSNDYQQYGIRLGVPKSEFGNAESGFLEFSRTTEEDTLYGGEYSGAFALSGSETYQGRLHTERSFTDDWRGMADYQFGWTNSEAQGGGLITDISRLRFDGLRVGVEGSSLFGVPFGGGGLMRFGITRQSGIRSGTIRLRYGVATTSEFIEDYQYALNNGYEIVEREFSLATKPTTLYHWGYTFAPRAQMQAAFGLEYNATANDKDNAAASLVLNWSY